MSLQLYDRDETDFTHRGLSLPDAYNAVVDWKMNESFTLTFDYPIQSRNGNKIENEMIVKAPTPDGDNLFRIQTRIRSMGVVSVTAYQVFWDLVSNFIEDINIVGDTGAAALDHIMENTQYKHHFKYTSGLRNTANVQIVRMNVVNALIGTDDNTFISRYGGEFDWQGFSFTVQGQIGENRGVVFRNKKNLTGYKETVDITSVVTRIMPEGYNGLFLPEKYIDSPLINNYISPRIAKVAFSDIKALDPLAQTNDTASSEPDPNAVPLEVAYTLLRNAAKQQFSEDHVDLPIRTYELNVVTLENTEEYKGTNIFTKVYPGDTVKFIHTDDGIVATARLTGYTYNPLIGEYLTQSYNSSSRSPDDIGAKLSSISDQIHTVDESVTLKAAKVATSLITSGFGGHIKVEPDRITIMDSDSELNAQKVWQWNVNGLGYSGTGINGPYGTAITMDGHINGEFISAGSIEADMIKAGSITADKLSVDAIQVGINDLGDTIKINPIELGFYNDGKQVLGLTKNGLHVLDDGVDVGWIHGNSWLNKPDLHGLTFDLNQSGDYMAWGVFDQSTSSYLVKLAWYNDKAAQELNTPPGFYFDDDVYVQRRKI